MFVPAYTCACVASGKPGLIDTRGKIYNSCLSISTWQLEPSKHICACRHAEKTIVRIKFPVTLDILFTNASLTNVKFGDLQRCVGWSGYEMYQVVRRHWDFRFCGFGYFFTSVFVPKNFGFSVLVFIAIWYSMRFSVFPIWPIWVPVSLRFEWQLRATAAA